MTLYKRLARSAGNALSLLVRSAQDPDARFYLLSRLWMGREIHQTTGFTALNRYPYAFSQARAVLGDNSELKLLSFGCSTGEEVISLRRYFERATIIGAEINRSRLQQCRRLNLAGPTQFIHSNAREVEQAGPYDAIFAMAVLQKLPKLVEARGETDLMRIYPFAKFERQLVEFDRWLKPGGLIVIQNTQYRFSDSSIAVGYRAIAREAGGAGPLLFNKESRLIPRAQYEEIIFQKYDDSRLQAEPSSA